MTLEIIFKPLLLLAYFITKIKERRLGYSLVFDNLPNTFIQGHVVFEMDQVWQNEGLNAVGTNYFTFGATNNGLSSRFNADSPYYQSWLGGYIVKFNQNKSWNINDHFLLAKADQNNWLKIYGNNKPKVEIDSKEIDELGEVEISNYRGHLFRGNIFSNTDVGDGKISFYNRLKIAGLAIYFNQSNPSLNIDSSQLIPYPNRDLESYQPIKLRGYIAILNITESVKVVLYVNAAIYTDKNGKEYDNFKVLDKELLQMIKNINIKASN